VCWRAAAHRTERVTGGRRVIFGFAAEDEIAILWIGQAVPAVPP
jgi:hypothetical protein